MDDADVDNIFDSMKTNILNPMGLSGEVSSLVDGVGVIDRKYSVNVMLSECELESLMRRTVELGMSPSEVMRRSTFLLIEEYNKVS